MYLNLLRRFVREILDTASNTGRWRHFLLVVFVILFTLETGSRELFPLDTGSRACLQEKKTSLKINLSSRMIQKH